MIKHGFQVLTGTTEILYKSESNKLEEDTMKEKQLFVEYDESKQMQYEEEIRARYGKSAFKGVKDWNSYTTEEKERIKNESQSIYTNMIANMSKGYNSPEVQQQIAAWHQHLRYFYEPTNERLLGLADLYNEHPDFIVTFKAFHPELPEFMRKAIQYYVSKNSQVIK